MTTLLSLIAGLGAGLGLVLVLSVVWWRAPGPRRGGVRSPFSVLRARLAQAGMPAVPVPAVILIAILSAATIGAIAFATVAVFPIALAAAGLGAALPFVLITVRARARRRATRVVWPDVVDHLVSAVRSGLALPDGLMTLAESGPPITRSAFASFAHDYRATGSFSACLDRLKDALADPVADRILETLRMSREVGGTELTSVLRSLAFALRQQAAIRAEVEARQSWVLNAAKLGVAAPWVILVLLSTRPEAAAAYNSPAGVLLIVVGLLVTAVAYRFMLVLGRLPEERRWFG